MWSSIRGTLTLARLDAEAWHLLAIRDNHDPLTTTSGLPNVRSMGIVENLLKRVMWLTRTESDHQSGLVLGCGEELSVEDTTSMQVESPLANHITEMPSCMAPFCMLPMLS